MTTQRSARKIICKRLRDVNAARRAVDRYAVFYCGCCARAATASIPWTHEKQYHHLALAKPHHLASGPSPCHRYSHSTAPITGGGFVVRRRRVVPQN